MEVRVFSTAPDQATCSNRIGTLIKLTHYRRDAASGNAAIDTNAATVHRLPMQHSVRMDIAARRRRRSTTGVWGRRVP